MRSTELYRVGFVANDGDYVVTAGPWDRGGALTIRNARGRGTRFHRRATRGRQKLDASQEYLEIEVAFYNDSYEQARSISRRGCVLDASGTPPGFQIPELACSAPATLSVYASLRNLRLACIDYARDHGVIREYELADGHFRLVLAAESEAEDVRWWRARDFEDEPGPRETTSRDGEVVSERCGSGVAAPP